MSFKVAFIGAGSIGFTRKIVRDLLCVDSFKNIEITFMDINEHNLEMVRALCQRDIDSNKISITINTTTNQKEAVTDANYVFVTARIGGLEGFDTDIKVPLKYGLDQCVGDTLCAGGIMYGQRGVPFIMNLCKDIKQVSHSNCLILNHTNPNAMITWAANHYGKVQTIGLCHGVQHGHRLIANALGYPKDEIDYICAGINHQTWYIQLKHKGKDVKGELLEALENHEEYSKTEKVRIDMLKRFGYFSTESNGHLSEYVPWYRKRINEISEWIDTSVWIHGQTAGYLRVCIENRNWFEEEYPQWMEDEPYKYTVENRSEEHGSYIVEGLETGKVYRGHFNIVNNGCITNLPDDAIVEVPGYVDRNGVNIPKVGDLPLGCAAVCQSSIQVQRMSVEAAINGDIILLKQAMMMDPLTGAVLNPPEIWQMTDEMLVEGEKWLPQYKKDIIQAKERLKNKKIKTNDSFKGAVRLDVKSINQLRKEKK
ncbi:MAG: alpha-glucosidase/alpha-galactosidase [Clostridiales bacterium]|nr:alpha-glucosidase/alpha-galactosidase [Clostridiales bacterium]